MPLILKLLLSRDLNGNTHTLLNRASVGLRKFLKDMQFVTVKKNKKQRFKPRLSGFIALTLGLFLL